MAFTMRLPTGLRRIAPPLIHAAARFTRPLTIGVRAVVVDRTGSASRVFLVKHSYVSGWHLPGGAVEVGESAAEALAREVREECAIRIGGTPTLIGLYFNRAASRRDHVATYLVEDFQVTGRRDPDWEIVEAGFFPRGALPEGTTASTQARIAEALDGLEPAAEW